MAGPKIPGRITGFVVSVLHIPSISQYRLGALLEFNRFEKIPIQFVFLISIIY
jgi:hypothetical protein